MIHVLFTTDGSRESAQAIRTGIRLLKTPDCEIDVLCVAPGLSTLPSERRKARTHARYHHRIGEETRRILQEARSLLKAEGIEAQTISESGSPVEVILRLSRDYDLTVLGARGKAVESQSGLGPVASRVAEHSSGSILIARESPGVNGPRILAAVDGSLASYHALDATNTLCDLRGAEVTLLHVIESPWLHLNLEPDWFDYQQETGVPEEPEFPLDREMQREAEALIELARDRILGQHPATVPMILRGNPANEILSEAERGGYDLVVIGATGATDFKRVMLGSVSAKVAWNAPCSVLLVRGGELLEALPEPEAAAEASLE
jgi:nucleotide-binding universal stress UspA family protein